jgi:hypothetical protein
MTNTLDLEPKKVSDDTGIEAAKLIWDEYKYRHEHVWKLIVQVTVAVVIISIIPYSQPLVSARLREGVVLLPLVGFALTLIARARLIREMEILGKLRSRHREIQKELHGIEHGAEASSFSEQVKLYLVSILILEAVNVVVLLFLWLESPQS